MTKRSQPDSPAVHALLANLNEAQRVAVEHGEGPLLVFAGAGSGKTRTLTHRIAHLIEAHGVPPDRLLAVTFTNKAANEMKERIAQLIGDRAQAVWAGTFHSMCARLLRRHAERIGLRPNYTILDTPDQLALIKEALAIANYDSKEFRPPDVLGRISNAKNELVDVPQFRRTRKGAFDRTVAQIYKIYQEKLTQNNALDFDDLIMQAVRVLRECEDVLGWYQEQFLHVLVDEYQDINFAQYTLVKLLSGKHRNLCVVGDDDQSIYGWRGADVVIILDFENDYPDAKVIKLEQNYRSTSTILECANEVIAQNTSRAAKRLWTDQAGGPRVLCYEAVNEQEEASYVARRIGEQAREERRRYNEFAILYRTNAQSRVLEEAFLSLGLPYRIVGGLRFYERREIKDLVAYLRLLQNPADGVALRRIVNVPARGIGTKTIEALDRLAYAQQIPLFEACRAAEHSHELGPKAVESVRAFFELAMKLVEQVDQVGLTELTNLVLDETGYLQSWRDEGTAEGASRVENLQEFLSLTKKFEEARQDSSLGAFLEHVALLSDVDESDDSHNAVALMTLHAAKGLEFPVVFICGLEEKIFPHQRSMSETRELEEERRLCYVGITRAREHLTLTYCRRRTIYGRTEDTIPSRFLAELPGHHVHRCNEITKLLGPPALLEEPESEAAGGPKLDLVEILTRAKRAAEQGGQQPTDGAGARRARARKSGPEPQAPETPFRAGEKVAHPKFGKGVVVNCVDDVVTVGFRDHGVKKLKVEYANLERA